MSQNNNIDLIEFPASSHEDLAKETEFFSNVFGWNFKDWGGKYADTNDSGITFGINTSDTDTLQKMPLTVLYCDSIEETKAKIITAGGKIIHDTYSFPGGKRFHFSDPIGNELAVWSK